MKKLILCGFAALFLLSGCRSLTPEQQEAKRQREAIENFRDERMFALASQAIDKQNFVLEASRLLFRDGNSAMVNSSTNYIAVRGDNATVQVAPFNGGGPNGVGGITVTGRPSDFQVKADNKGNVIVKFNVQGANISASVFMTLYKDSARTTATISPNFNSNTITLEGNTVPADESNVVKGIGF